MIDNDYDSTCESCHAHADDASLHGIIAWHHARASCAQVHVRRITCSRRSIQPPVVNADDEDDDGDEYYLPLPEVVVDDSESDTNNEQMSDVDV